MEKIIQSLRKELKKLASAEGQTAAGKFHKEEIKTYGIKVPVVRNIAKENFREIKSLGKDVIYQMCDELFAAGYIEEAHIACEWTFLLKRQFEKTDLKQFRYWIENHINNWATCDNFCNNTVGSFLLMYPEFVPQLNKWAVTKNRWLQRASAVSLILPARNGKFLEESFAVADLLLRSEDDLVQKGYGWLLKSQSKPHAKEVFRFVEKRKNEMPRTALRYAIEHFSSTQKDKLMGRYRTH
ncbi:MAG: DNA alkylation repair protein [Chitinophagaceae bacterium]|nr:DNA alkylation repair protein [Chitinophagaceae bacterium]